MGLIDRLMRVKNVEDFKYALVFFSQSDDRKEVELFKTENSREDRKENLKAAGIESEYAHVNRTY